MKALLLTRPSTLEIVEFDDPRPGDGEVLVRIRACGICGSDIHGWDGSSGRRRPPLIMGHEAAGEVAACGPKVQGWSVGDRVAFDSMLFCGACAFCRAGRTNLCPRRRVIGVASEGYRQHGAFAEYLALPARLLHRIPDGCSFAHAALSEPLAVALHAIGRAGTVRDACVAVVGCGMIGLFVIQALRAAGAGRIIAVDLDEGRLARARRLGATDALRSDADVLARIRQISEGGVDAGFEAVGIAPTVNIVVEALKPGGTAVLIGNLAPRVEYPLQSVVTRELCVQGSCGSAGEYPDVLDMIAAGTIDADAMIETVAPLEAGPEWFARLSGPDGARYMKVILEP